MTHVTKTIVFATLPVVVLLVAAELGWRTYLSVNGRGFFDDPNEFTSPFFTTYDEPRPAIQGDQLGYRNGSVSRTKAPGEVRVIAFGGSTTVNFRPGISYTDILERQFADEFGASPPVRVLNAGGEGYSTAHVLVNLALRNLEAAPDVITVFENINDHSTVWFGDGVVPDYANKYKTDFYLGMRHRTGVIAGIAKVSRLARFLIGRANALAFPAQQADQSRDFRPALPYFSNNLRSIVAVAKAHGIRILLASQPARADCRTPAFIAFNDEIRRIAADERVPFVDLAAEVVADSAFLPDCIHNTRAGVEQVAAVLHDSVAALVTDVRRARAPRE